MGGEAFELVDWFIVADLAEEVAERVEVPVVLGGVADGGLVVEFGMLGNEMHVPCSA